MPVSRFTCVGLSSGDGERWQARRKVVAILSLVVPAIVLALPVLPLTMPASAAPLVAADPFDQAAAEGRPNAD